MGLDYQNMAKKTLQVKNSRQNGLEGPAHNF